MWENNIFCVNLKITMPLVIKFHFFPSSLENKAEIRKKIKLFISLKIQYLVLCLSQHRLQILESFSAGKTGSAEKIITLLRCYGLSHPHPPLTPTNPDINFTILQSSEHQLGLQQFNSILTLTTQS